MADTGDSKSPAPYGREGSNPSRTTLLKKEKKKKEMLTIFYILGALVLGLWYWLVSREDNGLAFLSVFAGLGALELYGYPVLDSIISNSKYVLLWAGVYFLIGFIWSIPKWYLWSKKQFAIYEKERKDW